MTDENEPETIWARWSAAPGCLPLADSTFVEVKPGDRVRDSFVEGRAVYWEHESTTVQ